MSEEKTEEKVMADVVATQSKRPKSGSNWQAFQKRFRNGRKANKDRPSKKKRTAPRPGHWKCAKCHNWNVDELAVCEKCKRDKNHVDKKKEEPQVDVTETAFTR